MKQPLIGTVNVNLSIQTPRGFSSPSFLDMVIGKASATNATTSRAILIPPAIGSLWEDQGGIYMGIREYPDALYYVIAAETDAGVYAWGERGIEAAATSKTDGLDNTMRLCGLAGQHPAAIACTEFQSGKFHDFYLPAIAELNHCWAVAPESFEKDGYYWSSTQRSAYYAFLVHFVDGDQCSNVKDNEFRVRPVRRSLIR